MPNSPLPLVESLVQTLTWIIAGLILGQSALLFAYVRFLYWFRRPALADSECPRAAVVLCVRGLDPFLPACLKGLFHQDYPDYDVWIVVDSIHDAAGPWSISWRGNAKNRTSTSCR